MTEHCIIKADFSATRAIAGRKCLALTFEVPIEQADEVLAKLGGYPQPGHSRWCAIALLDETKLANGERKEPDSVTTSQASEAGGYPKKHWNELARSQQAYLLCTDPDFQRYFETSTAAEASTKLREHFNISSRSVLDMPYYHSHWDEFVALYHLHRDRLR